MTLPFISTCWMNGEGSGKQSFCGGRSFNEKIGKDYLMMNHLYHLFLNPLYHFTEINF